MPAVLDGGDVDFPPGSICKDVNIVDGGQSISIVVTIDCALNVLCMVVCLKTSDNALVFRLDVGSQVWFEVLNVDGGEAI